MEGLWGVSILDIVVGVEDTRDRGLVKFSKAITLGGNLRGGKVFKDRSLPDFEYLKILIDIYVTPPGPREYSVVLDGTRADTGALDVTP